jgi:hypothetical protein
LSGILVRRLYFGWVDFRHILPRLARSFEDLYGNKWDLLEVKS